MELGIKPELLRGKPFFRGKGCDNCNGSGFRGRLALFEIMTMDDTMREMVMKNANTASLRRYARSRGMRSLRECGLLAIHEGLTTIDEVIRETLSEED
jgi:type IV pilus assembly protein PilB